MLPNIIVSKCVFTNVMYLSDLVATSEEKWKNTFISYKSFDLVQRNEITNISASICPMCMIVSSLDSKSGEKLVISISKQLFLLSRSYKVQLKVKEKCCLKSF